MKAYYVNVKTQEQYWELMSILEKKGYYWLSGHKMKYDNKWWVYKENTYIFINEGTIEYGNKECSAKNYISLEEYKKEIGIMFTKDDLEIGMLVETRNGNKYVVMPQNKLFNVNGKTHMDLTDYEDNLNFYKELVDAIDIMKVYSYVGHSFDFECKHRELLWERKETPEYTMGELREKFVKHEFKIKE